MESPLQTSSYKRVILIDTQVILETKPFEQLPWLELGEGPILLLVCRQVQSEIDAKKNDGRLGTRARNFNKILDVFLESRIAAELVLGPPKVDVALVRNVRIDWNEYGELDPSDGDDKIVAQALNAQVDNRERIELLSHDMRPRDAAITHGMRAIKLPEHWLREPEPSPDERERAKLERELRVLKTEQPAIGVTIELVTPAPWRKLTVEPASDEQAETIRKSILRAAPRQSGYSFSLDLDRTFDERHDKWRKRLVELDLPAMHLGIQQLYAQYRIAVQIRNEGPIPAEGLSLEVRSGNVVLHSVPYGVLVFGEVPPRPRPFHEALRAMDLSDLRPASRHEPFTFYAEESGPGSVLTWSCSSFRQEKKFDIELSVELMNATAGKAQIEVVVTAQNMKGDVRKQILVPLLEDNLSFSEAVDIENNRVRSGFSYNPVSQNRNKVRLNLRRNDGSFLKK